MAAHRRRAPEGVDAAAGASPHDIGGCYREFGPATRAYLQRKVPAADVDDVMQIVFYEVWRCRSRYDPQRPLRAWILGIAHKRAIDHLRKRHDSVTRLGELPEAISNDGREDAQRHADADHMGRLLNALSPRYRQVITMAYYGGLTQSEISSALDIPLGTVKTRTCRALLKLADLIENAKQHDVAADAVFATDPRGPLPDPAHRRAPLIAAAS